MGVKNCYDPYQFPTMAAGGVIGQGWNKLLLRCGGWEVD